MDFFDKFDEDAERRLSAMDNMFESLRTNELVMEGLDWVNSSMTESDAASAVRRIAGSNAVNVGGIRQWINSQPSGDVRDHAHAGRADWMASQNRFPGAMAEAANIQEPELGNSVRLSIGRQWLEADETAASQALSPDLIEQIRKP